MISPLAKAAIAVGSDGLIIEVHNNPEKSLCDGPQSIRPDHYETLIQELRAIAGAVGREL